MTSNPSSHLSSKIPALGNPAVVKIDYKSSLPRVYGDTKVVLLPRDNTWLYSYWEISQGTVEGISKIYGDAFNPNYIALRIYDVSGIVFDGSNANKFFDIHVGIHNISWYVDLGEYNRSVCADLGFFLKDGRFISAARSNVVEMPRYGVSDITDEVWGSIDITEESLRWFKLGHGATSLDFMKLMSEKWKEYSMMPGSFSQIKQQKR
ncbi:MAG: DUF4912 domain-containing protein [Endomicrobium sp.]|jgi:hypothetical protein|nr:DUF4912 domain-containing protein [Endomicrobium sp.]